MKTNPLFIAKQTARSLTQHVFILIQLVTFTCQLLCFGLTFHTSIYGATAHSGPWPPSQGASIHPCFHLFSSILLSPAVVMHPSGSA